MLMTNIGDENVEQILVTDLIFLFVQQEHRFCHPANVTKTLILSPIQCCQQHDLIYNLLHLTSFDLRSIADIRVRGILIVLTPF